MKRIFQGSIFAALLTLSLGLLAAEPRFDATYFFQSEATLKEKQIDFKDLARYSRQIQSQVWKALKKVSLAPSRGYLVIAVKADQQVGVWLDMEPALHEYYENEVLEASKKVLPFYVAEGAVVFGIQMSIDSPVHTRKTKPEPKAWAEAKKKLENPNDIEALVQAAWPE
jgi:hypothetical protein